MMTGTIKNLVISASLAGLMMACGGETTPADQTGTEQNDTNDTDLNQDSDGNSQTDQGGDGTDTGTGNDGTEQGNDGNDGNTQSGDQDPTAADPNASITLTGGNIRDCMPGLLDAGEKAAYSGFAGSSYGAYFIWKDSWAESSMNFRIETWDSFGGVTGPGTYTIQERDTNYADCGVCIFSETAEDGEFWLTEGSTVNFTSLTTGSGGLGKALAGTIEGTFTNGLCVGTIEAEFSGISRNMDNGPL